MLQEIDKKDTGSISQIHKGSLFGGRFIFKVLPIIALLFLVSCGDLASSDPAKVSNEEAGVSSESSSSALNESQDSISEMIENQSGKSEVADSCVVIYGRYQTINYYQWIELYADGSKDTVLSKSYGYPGVSLFAYQAPIPAYLQFEPEPFFPHGPSSSMRDSLNFCLGDSLYEEYVAGKDLFETTSIQNLNFGPDAMDSLVAPIVKINKKEEIQARLGRVQFGSDSIGQFQVSSTETIQLGSDSSQLFLDLEHFSNDSVYFISNLPDWVSIEIWNPFIGENPRNGEGFKWSLRITPPDSGIAGNVDWWIGIKNRFGYTDTLKVSTELYY